MIKSLDARLISITLCNQGIVLELEGDRDDSGFAKPSFNRVVRATGYITSVVWVDEDLTTGDG